MNYKHSCVVNESGMYLALVRVLLPEDAAPQIQGYTLSDGELLIDAARPNTRAYAGAPGFIKPLWDGSAWAEGATAKEIAAWEEEHPAQEPVVSPPSQLDSVEAQSIYTAMMTDTLLEG